MFDKERYFDASVGISAPLDVLQISIGQVLEHWERGGRAFLGRFAIEGALVLGEVLHWVGAPLQKRTLRWELLFPSA
jgi:hypothetical protein